MKKTLGILFTCLCVGLGLALPWLAAARQDREVLAETFPFQAPQDLTAVKADLFSRLALVGSPDQTLVLSGPTFQHTEAVRTALDTMARQGWAIFAPDRWTLVSAEALLCTRSGETMVHEKGQSHVSVTSNDLSAMVWDCRLTTPEGEELGLLLDNDLGLVLSFAYRGTEPQTLTQETALTGAAFCRNYYQTDVLSPTQAKDGSWRITLRNQNGETFPLALTASGTELHLMPFG